MKIIRPYLFVIIALLAGWAIGSFTSDRFYEKWIKRYQMHNAFDGISDRLAVLNTLRAGDTNGPVELLEGQMDSQIAVFGAMARDLQVEQLPPWDLRLLTRLRDYRAEYPRKTNSLKTDQIITGVLSLTNTPDHP